MDAKILERIQKLLCLAADKPEGHESQLAAERAAELMAKHNIGIEDVDSHGNMKSGSIIEETLDVVAHHHQIWESHLAQILCECFDCKRFVSSFGRKVATRTFIGTKSDVMILSWFYKYLRLRIAKQSERDFNTQAKQKAFGLGAVQALEPRLKEMYKRKQAMTPVDSRALVLTKQVAVDDLYHKRVGNSRSKQKYSAATIDRRAFESGTVAGSTMSINQQIGG